MQRPESQAAFERATQSLVGGVNSPVRAYRAVEKDPVFVASAKGSRITDVDGNAYVDYVCSYGPGILGHAPEPVLAVIREAIERGTTYGAPTEIEVDLAETIIAAFDSIEKVRFVSSGTEALMTAIRLARGATGRNGIIKCKGCYHGHSDALLVAAGSGATTLGVPNSPGVTPGAVADTHLVPYNDLAAVEAACTSDVAAVLVEPVAGNMGVIPPQPGYLEGLREICDRTGALLIFDEVITGFRLTYGGAQTVFGVRPDITTLGKIIGGGMPVGALGGPAAIMDHLSPVGPVYQAGTLSGNPIAMAAGLATLAELRADGFYDALESKSASLAEGLAQAASAAGLAETTCFSRIGSMMCGFFRPGPVVNHDDTLECNTDAYAAYFGVMLDGGVWLAPSQFEAMFVSAAHTDEDVARTIAVASDAFAAAAQRMP